MRKLKKNKAVKVLKTDRVDIAPARLREMPRPIRPAKRAVLQFTPYDDPDCPGQPAYAMYSVLGYCHVHDRMNKVIYFRGVSTGYDTCRVGVMDCGHICREEIF